MPVGSTVVITYNGTDITDRVLWTSARFEFQQNAVPGTFEMTVKDLDHTSVFVTGKELTLEIDGALQFGGFVLQVERTYPFAAMDTTDPDSVPRYWKLRGADYNRLLDFRVLRNTAAYTTQIPNFHGSDYDGDLISLMFASYLDSLGSGFDTTTFVDNIMRGQDRGYAAGAELAWNQQGDTARQQIEQFILFTGALFYIDAQKNFHHHAIEDTVMRWGFSDKPNHGGVTASPVEFQGATIGPREIIATEDGTPVVNDAFVWGGSSWTQGVVFARETNSASITDHGRWQKAEVLIGQEGFGIQAGVDARADLIVNGSLSAQSFGQNRGLKYPQYTYRFAWYAHDVPKISGVPDHVRPGYLSTISLEVFGDPGDPLVQLLPLRTVTITFPNLDKNGNGYVRYDGTFGLQPDDPYALWRFLLKGGRQAVQQTVIAVVDDSSTSTVYGAFGYFTPAPVADGVTTVFTIAFGYIQKTTQVYKNGLLLVRDVDYTESDPIAGEITFAVAPAFGDVLVVSCNTLSA